MFQKIGLAFTRGIERLPLVLMSLLFLVGLGFLAVLAFFIGIPTYERWLNQDIASGEYHYYPNFGWGLLAWLREWWFIFVALAILVPVVLRAKRMKMVEWRHRTLISQKKCPRCCYSLYGHGESADRCPECGTLLKWPDREAILAPRDSWVRRLVT